MVKYTCLKCNKVFNHKGSYTRHINRKYPCVQDDTEMVHNNTQFLQESNIVTHSTGTVPYMCKYCNYPFKYKKELAYHLANFCDLLINKPELSLSPSSDKHISCDSDQQPGLCKIGLNSGKTCTKNNICTYCNKEFSCVSSRNRHIRSYCKEKKRIEIEKEELYQSLVQQKESSTINNTVNNNSLNNNSVTNNINSHNNIVNHIKLVAFGKEKLDYIPKEKSIELLKSGFMSVPNTSEYVHFNPDTPEFHNVYIPNKKQPYVMVYNGDKWQLVKADDAIDQLYNDMTDHLKDKFRELNESLDSFTKKKFGNFSAESNEKDIIDFIKEKLMLQMYNNKDIPMSTKKKLKNLTVN